MYANSPKPARLNGAMQYLDLCENGGESDTLRLNDWVELPILPITDEELATKNAAIELIRAWMLKDLTIPFIKDELLPARIDTALEYLAELSASSKSVQQEGCCSVGLVEVRELDEGEKRLRLTMLEVLRNWFNGELELQPETPNQRRMFRPTNVSDHSISKIVTNRSEDSKN